MIEQLLAEAERAELYFMRVGTDAAAAKWSAAIHAVAAARTEKQIRWAA